MAPDGRPAAKLPTEQGGDDDVNGNKNLSAGDFSKAAQPGDYVEERIVDDMRDVLPPAKMERGFLQVGEPYSHEFDPETGHWRGTFPTFVKEGQNWKYCGNCFIGKTTPPPAPIRR